eukprot:CAMPEP_0172087894 /NCGR_PEP_ID=MMETSP1043-20130122/22939_1 /TAXON_ID=464988 /ORGANISM="Hemiselmis andersenii, Strain CCMP441" /LENGTH=67 /DNA_ID=CAMNT_0012750153 /DNA_START=1 /DNA_END=200 /DNA_ORIENTATION=-
MEHLERVYDSIAAFGDEEIRPLVVQETRKATQDVLGGLLSSFRAVEVLFTQGGKLMKTHAFRSVLAP